MMPKYVLLDMNTQRDFLDAGGGHPVLNREAVVANLRKVFALARKYHIPIVSAIDTHRDNEAFHGSPSHCVEGTVGHQKVKFSLMRNRTLVEANNTLDIPFNVWNQYRQVILRRRTRDFLGNPKADRLLTELQPKQFIVFGVGLERSIRRLVLGLIGRGRRVGFVPEACGYWNETDADLTDRLIVAKNGNRLDIEQLEALFKRGNEKRVQRVYSKPQNSDTERPPQSLAG